MIKIGIIDDEILARKVLEEYCSKIDNFRTSNKYREST